MDDSLNEVEWDGLVEGKLDGAFSLFVGRELLFKLFMTGWGRVKTDMICISGKVDQRFFI